MNGHYPASTELETTHSFETGVLEQGNISNMQYNGPRRPGLENPGLDDVVCWNHTQGGKLTVANSLFSLSVSVSLCMWDTLEQGWWLAPKQYLNIISFPGNLETQRIKETLYSIVLSIFIVYSSLYVDTPLYYFILSFWLPQCYRCNILSPWVYPGPLEDLGWLPGAPRVEKAFLKCPLEWQKLDQVP